MPDLTISLTPAQAQRVAAAIGKRLRLVEAVPGPLPEDPPTYQQRNATLEEAHAYLLNILKSTVKEEELIATVIPEL